MVWGRLIHQKCIGVIIWKNNAMESQEKVLSIFVVVMNVWNIVIKVRENWCC